MQSLEIGQRVIVTAVTTLEYEDVFRKLFRHSIVEMDAAVTGRTIRPLGKYHRSHGGDAWGDDFTPAELEVTGTAELWCVRFGLMNREHLVQDADLRPGSLQPYIDGCYFKLPKRARRITYIASPEEPVEITPSEPKRITFREPILLT